jgi:iron(III) transport system substrate-binding protein
LYTDWGTQQYQSAVDAFQKKYGIKVTVVRDVYANLGPKIDVELQSGQGIADAIVFSTPEPFTKYDAAGNLLKPVGPAFQGKTQYDAGSYVEGNAFQVGGVTSSFVWNTDSLKSGVHSWADFLDPKLANGKIGVQPPNSENNAEWWMTAEKGAGPDWLAKLAAQKPHIYDSAVPEDQAIVSGEIFATPRGFPVLANADKAKGAPVDLVNPPTPVAGTRHRGAVLKTAKHPNAAWLWFDYVLSPEGQKFINADGSSVIPGVGQAQNKDIPAPLNLTQQQVNDYAAKWNSLFGVG